MERLTERQIEGAKEASKRFEWAWKVFTFSSHQSIEDIREMKHFVVGEFGKYINALQKVEHYSDKELVDMVFAGLLHHGVTPPPEIRYKARLN